MKKYLLHLAVVLNVSMLCASKTVFVPRSITHDSTYELSLSNYDIYHHTFDSLRPNILSGCGRCSPQVNLYGSYFFQQSRRGCEVGSSFLPCDSNCVTVGENDGSTVNSALLGIVTPAGQTFKSEVCVNPCRRLQGAYLQAHLDFAYLDNWCRGWWLDFASAVVNARHSLGLTECVTSGEGSVDSIKNAIDALDNNAWNYNHFTNRRLCKTGLDDIQVKLGYNYYYNRCGDHVGLYLVGTIPTGHRRCNRFIFEPTVGTRNGAVGVGLNADWTFWNQCNQSFVWMADVKYRYLCRSCEFRSFDLCNGGWSRFLPVVRQEETAFTLPGINFLTHKVKVEPRGQVDFWTAGHYRVCNYNFEFGYNLWWRQSECIKCPPTLCNVGLFDLNGAATLARCPVSANCLTTCQTTTSAVSDSSFNAVTSDRLNLSSGTVDRALTHKVYGALGYTFDCCNVGSLIGIGGSYEFAQCKRNAFDHWAVWAKLGISF